MFGINDHLDVLVIGAGQAGLAMGFHLKQQPFRFLLVDQHARIGDSWRQRFDSLILFSPRAYSALPGLPVAGDPEGYPSKDEIAEYLEAYATHFELPVALDTTITRLERQSEGFRAVTKTGTVLTFRAVVLATGAFQQPAVPSICQQFSAKIMQLTPDDYQNPGRLPNGTVLVVGDGATGRQIALELTGSHRVLLATGRPRRVSPNRILGKNSFWWMDKLRILRASRESAIGRYLMTTDPFPGKDLELKRLQRRGVTVVGRLVEVDGRHVRFADGATSEVDVVVWATGYRDRTDWVAIPDAMDARGAFRHQRGISPVPNLYFIGRSWQWTRGSALLYGVGADVSYIVEPLVSRLTSQAPTVSAIGATRR